MIFRRKIRKGKNKDEKIFLSNPLSVHDHTIFSLFESLSEGVIVVDEKGKIIGINSRMSELTGFSKKEVIGKGLSCFIPNEFEKSHINHVENFFRLPKNRPMGIGVDLLAKKKDGSIFPVEISLSHIATKEGKAVIAFLNDITLRKKAENELRSRNQELDAYAHMVAHDLTSSIQGIIGFTELMLDKEHVLKDDEQEQYLKYIIQGSNQMHLVLRELLLFATMKKEQVKHSQINTKQLVNNVCTRLKFQIEKKSAIITIDEDLPNCFGYGPWVEEVWYNYISNALKYGGSPPKINIYAKQINGSEIKYCVEDNGKGIPLSNPMDVFSDIKKNQDNFNKGFGFGLSIVKNIMNKLDGKVDVTSQTGIGSTFCFTLNTVSGF